jgi:Domain of unknown function (DUF4926)
MKLLDVVALTEDIPEKRLLRGQVGTLVEQLTPEVFEVEFSDINGPGQCQVLRNKISGCQL